MRTPNCLQKLDLCWKSENLSRRQLFRIKRDRREGSTLRLEPIHTGANATGSKDTICIDQRRIFRRRFRVPFLLFRRIVAVYHERDLFPFKGKILDGGERVDSTNRPVIPLELKILGVLRILGRGWCLDDVKESSGISVGAMCEFFRQFCELFGQEYYYDFVKRSEGDDRQSVIEIY